MPQQAPALLVSDKVVKIFSEFLYLQMRSLWISTWQHLGQGVKPDARFGGQILDCYHVGFATGVTRLPLADEDSAIPSSYRVNQ